MLAEKHKKTPAQILIRYQIQSGNIAIPKSVTKERIHSNIEVFDWCLEDDDMEKLDELNRDHRYYPFKYIDLPYKFLKRLYTYSKLYLG